QLYGFAYIRELELLRESGFHPLEVIRSATIKGAEALGIDDQVGSIEIGKLADIVITKENPLANFQTLYGTGAIRVTEANDVVRVGGVEYTVKDGIVYNAKQLLEDVRKIVKAAKEESGEEIIQPGIEVKKP
ncbi:MAG TPA: amidohydrolase family protein, partial [Saprospiraceae bacterium]|nr:amidohydrolase family protein [Saprospiraceae bacterium]